jgi:O-antigen/teichoic acid export membrane protein
MLRFGVLLVPVALAGWVANFSDRFVLRIFDDLAEVAVYSVGYKVSTLVEVAIVWPFQLAWPTVAFSISRREGHERTYARTLTYLMAVLVFACVALSLVARVGVAFALGESYALAYRVVPLVTLAYALHGVHYCVSPAIHVAGATRYLTLYTILGAALNLALNFALIPRFGMMGAAAATALSFAAVAGLTWRIAQRLHPVPYETGRLGALCALGLAAAGAGLLLPAGPAWPAIGAQLAIALVVLPAGLGAVVLSAPEERDRLRALWQRYGTRPGS